MAHRVELRTREAVARLIPEGSRGLVALSGGGDSVALFHLLRRRARFSVAHLDHALRRGSTGDARFVSALCREHGVDFESARIDVEAGRRRDESLEEAARRVRRAFLQAVATERDASWIALGHTLDDQAETVLMRWVRGGGPTALAGMSEAGPGPFVRPLLRIGRDELRGWLQARDLPFREDPTNRDERFDRNRVRRRVMPVLQEALNPSCARQIVEAAERIREDAACLDALAEEYGERLGEKTSRGWRIAAGDAGELPLPIRSRVLKLGLVRAGVDPRRVGSRHLAAVEDLLGGGRGRRVDLPGGFQARKDSRRRLCIELAR